MQFWKILSFLLLALILFSVNIFDAYSADTVRVQTLTFNDITNRRFVWKFPDTDDKYRKILMNVTLKCDRQTAHDIFDCGEWDYLAHYMVNKHTSIMDSTFNRMPMYNWGRGFPDSLRYVTTPTSNSYIKTKNKIVYDNISNETEYPIGNGSSFLVLTNQPTKMQVLFSKDLLKNNNLTGKTFNRLKLDFNTGNVVLKNFTVRIINSSKKNLTEFEEGKFTTLYEGDYPVTQGVNTINFLESFKTLSFQGVVIQLSYDSIENADAIVLIADELADCIISPLKIKDSYLELDGRYDYVKSGVIDELKGAKKFTVEMRLKLDSWRNHNFFFKIDDMLQFKTAEEYNQPKRYFWYMADSAGYGILVAGNVDYTSKWNHFAFVYDGTKGQYDGRIKFYINGSEVSGNIRGRFPDSLPITDKILSLCDANNNYDCDMDEFRIWTTALDKPTINSWMNQTLDNTHPNYQDIAVYYSMDKIENYVLKDESGKNHDGIMIGVPAQRNFEISDNLKNQRLSESKPQISLIEGTYTSHIDKSYDTVEVENSAMSVITYELNGKKVNIKNIDYVFEPGLFFTYDSDGNKADSVNIQPTNFITQDTITYYGEPFEIMDSYEIGRFITPYGKGLTLGPDGYTWVYDVTDYAPLLKGDVDFSAGNEQELIDVRFDFIKGTPPRDVLRIDRPWGPMNSYSYANLDNDISLKSATINVLPAANQYKVKARLTGHGHNSNDGKYPHCCEWKDNTHFLMANGEDIAAWHIWRYIECGMNPVFPQGGTWPGQREGWCPGDAVFDYEFEITDFIKGDSFILDYDLTPVPTNNLGMGGGNYVMNWEVIEYSDLNYEIDAEVYSIITPNEFSRFTRLNATCFPPVIIIRNNGRENLTSLKISYGVSGGQMQSFTWIGNLKSMAYDTVSIPIINNEYLLGDDKHLFSVTVSEPNNKQDEYADNNIGSSHFVLPDMYNKRIVIWYKTNNEPQYYTYAIRDYNSNVLFDRSGLNANTLYKDTIDLPDGCYVLEFLSMRETGLSYWAYPEQGQGYLRIYDEKNVLLKSFEPDFGLGIFYSFDLGGVLNVEDPGLDNLLQIFPNPATETVNITLDYFIGNALFEIYNSIGKKILVDNVFVDRNFNLQLNTRNYASGTYYVRIFNDTFDVKNKFVKKD